MVKTELKSLKNYPIAPHTTLKTGGNAEYAYFPVSVDELKEIIQFHKYQNDPITVIGAGSNILVSSQGIKGAVIFTKNMISCELCENGDISVLSGLKSASLAKFAYQKRLSGAEFLVGIPGLVGGAVYMNSGAHGQCIKDIIVCADILDTETNQIKSYCNDDLELDYRSSIIEDGRHIILRGLFRLEKGDKAKIKEHMDFHINYRAQRHPSLSEPNCGSTFRNPADGVYVAKLLQEAGAKNWIEGGVKIAERHANFLHNFNNATSLDISRLMLKMYTQVKENYGYEIIPEVKYLGEMSEEEKEIWNTLPKH